MLRFSMILVAVLALMGTTTFAVSPASALSGEAFNKCMAKCAAQGGRYCTWWCDKKH